MAQVNLKRLSIEDWMQWYSDNGPFELIDGEIIELPPLSAGSGRRAGRLYAHLFNHCVATRAGQPFVEVSFVLTQATDWVRGSRRPDVMFYSASRWQAYVASGQHDEDGPVRLVPDMVAEVVSPTDAPEKVQRKIDTYLADGVQLIWLIYPDSETVVVHRAGQNLSETLHSGDTLGGEAIIPGFTLSLDTLFSTIL